MRVPWGKDAQLLVCCGFAPFYFQGTSVTEQSQAVVSQPWWKNGYVWMVLGGPLTVVVASLATFYIAVHNPDPVLDTGSKANETAHSGGAAAEDAMVPALLGRNHAATGGVPEKK